MSAPEYDRVNGLLLWLILSSLFGIQWCRMQKRRVSKRTLRSLLSR